jgi:hypothetical protein
MSDKIKSQHLQREAILYVRRSSTYQLHNSLESQKNYSTRCRSVCGIWAGVKSKLWMKILVAQLPGP